MACFPVGPDLVGLEDRVDEDVRAGFDRDGGDVFGRHGLFGDLLQAGGVVPGNADVRQGQRQADVLIEREYGFESHLIVVFEDELADGAEGDDFPVARVLAFGQRGKAAIEGVGAGASGRFDADAGEQGVDFDDVLHGFGQFVVLHVGESLAAFGHQGRVAQFRKSHRGQRRLVAGADAVLRVRIDVGFGFKISRERVAHAEGQVFCRGVEDDLGVDEYEVWVAFIINRARVFPGFGVGRRQSRSRRVGGGDGRDRDDGRVGLNPCVFPGVHRLAAADPDDHVGVRFACHGSQTVELCPSRLPPEGFAGDHQPFGFKGLGQHRGQLVHKGRRDHGEGPRRFQIGAPFGEVFNFPGPLNVFGRAGKSPCLKCHNNILPLRFLLL